MVDYRHFDDPSYFDSYKLTTEKFASQSSETLQNLFSLLSGIAKCIVYGALIASQGVALLLIVLGCSAFVAYAQIYWSRVSVERETAMVNDQRKADYLRRLFFDHTAVADLRASNIKKPLFSLFDGSVKSRAAIYRKYGAKEFLTDILANLAQLGTTFAVPVYVAWGVMSGNIGGIGVYATLIASSLALKEALNALGWWSSQVALGVAYAQKVQRFFDTDSTIEASTDGEKASDGPFSVRFDHVSYRYGGSDEFAIRDLSLAIAPGEKIAIVGENGAGKTTLTKLLLRLYDADGGTVQINGRPIADYDVSTLRGRIGIAFQQSRLYALSVRENMTAYADADDARLKSCLEEVGLAAFSGRAGHEGVRRKRRGALGRRRAAPMPDAAAAQRIWAAHPRRAVQRAGSDRRVPHRKADLRPLADDHRYGRAPALHGRGRGPNLSSLRWKNHRIRHARGADGAERKISGNVFKAGRRVLESLAEVWYNKSKFFSAGRGAFPLC